MTLAPPSPEYRYTAPPWPLAVQLVKLLSEVTANVVVASGMVTAMQPPLPSEWLFMNVLAWKTNGSRALPELLATWMLSAPPSLPAALLLNVHPETVVEMLSIVGALNAIEPPRPDDVQPPIVNELSEMLDDAYDTSYRILMAPPLSPVAWQLLTVVEPIFTSLLLTADTYSTSIAPPRVAMHPVSWLLLTLNPLFDVLPLTIADKNPPTPLLLLQLVAAT